MKLKHGKKKLKENTYHFQQYETMRSFGENSYTHKARVVYAEKGQSNLLRNIVEFNNTSRPKTKEGKDKKEILMELHMLLMKVENELLML